MELSRLSLLILIKKKTTYNDGEWKDWWAIKNPTSRHPELTAFQGERLSRRKCPYAGISGSNQSNSLERC